MPESVYTSLLLAVQAVWLLAPGLVLGLELARRAVIPRYLVVPVAGVVGCVFGYGAVWFYFAHVNVGRVYSWLSLALAVAAVVLLVRQPDYRAALRDIDVAGPLILLYLASLWLVAATFSCSVAPTLLGLNGTCNLSGFSGDNLLPLIVADNVLQSRPRAVIWDWQSSARPPLQTGVVLMQTGIGSMQMTTYQSLSVLLQVLCLPAMWAMLRFLRLTGYRFASVLTMFVFTGFFVFHSMFVWPKLLAAAMVLTAFALLYFVEPNRWMWALAGVAAGCGMVAHSGVAFTLIPMGLVPVLLRRYRPSWGHVVRAAIGVALVVGPWIAYQKIIDPPGDQLLKWHFAGVWQPASDKDRAPLTEVVADAYGDLSAGQIAANKLDNFRDLFGHRLGHELAGPGVPGNLRAEEMNYLLFGLGLFNLALVLVLFPSIRRRLPQVLDVPRLKLTAVLAVTTLVIWPLILFGKGSVHATPVIYQGSYAMMAMLYIVLGGILATLPRRAMLLLAAVHVTYTTAMWFVLVWAGRHLRWSHLPLAALAWVAVLVALWWVGRRDEAHDVPDGIPVADEDVRDAGEEDRSNEQGDLAVAGGVRSTA